MFFKKKPKEDDKDLASDYDKALLIAMDTLKHISGAATDSKSSIRARASKALDQIADVRGSN
jgi:hypothetical protein